MDTHPPCWYIEIMETHTRKKILIQIINPGTEKSGTIMETQLTWPI